MPSCPASRVAKSALTALLLTVVHPADSIAVDSDGTSIFSLHGFGTLGEVHSDSRQADFVGSPFQPNGAGYTRSWAPGVDSKVGLQADARLSGKLSATLQVVSQHLYDDKWTPKIEWANLKYQFTPDLSMRVGRTVADFFMLSDTRLVGYTYPWIRPPVELYGEVSITNLDGVGATYRLHLDAVTNSASVTYAKAKHDFPGKAQAKSAQNFFVTSDTLEAGPITIRIGYESFVVEFDSPTIDTLFGGITQFGEAAAGFGFPVTGAQAFALRDRYKPDRVRFSMTTVGALYDSGHWLLMAEWAKLKASAAVSDSTAWYITGGYRFGKFTPYATLSSLRADTKHEPGIPTAGLPPPLAAGATSVNAALTQAIVALAPSQKNVSVGGRWDFMKNTDLKIQYNRLKLGTDSSGRLDTVQPGFQLGGAVNVFSVAIDFVF